MAVLVLVAAAVKGVIDSKVWNDAPTWILLTLLITIGVATFRDNFTAARATFTRPVRARQHADIQKVMIAALASISKARNVPLEELGASIFVIRPGLRLLPARLRDRWNWSCAYLDRTHRVRLTDSPQPTDVDWTRGKGAIGRCWETEKRHYVYWLGIAARYGNAELDEASFRRIRQKTTQRMTLREFRAIVDKYAEILTVPMKQEDGKVVGVVSVDLARGGRTASMGRALDDRDVENIVTTAVAVVQKTRDGR